MSKKILSICGSPRKGNSESILLRIQEILKERGVDNEIVLSHSELKGNFNDIFESGISPDIEKDLKKLVNSLIL